MRTTTSCVAGAYFIRWPPGPATDGRRRVTRGQRDPHHPAAAGLDDVAADDGVGRPVGALDQDIGLDGGDNRQRRLLVEHHHGIDGSQRRQDLGPLRVGGDRPVRRLGEGTDGPVGVDRDNQRVALRTCLNQVARMPRVEQVEDAVGEDHPATGGALLRRPA